MSNPNFHQFPQSKSIDSVRFLSPISPFSRLIAVAATATAEATAASSSSIELHSLSTPNPDSPTPNLHLLSSIPSPSRITSLKSPTPKSIVFSTLSGTLHYAFLDPVDGSFDSGPTVETSLHRGSVSSIDVVEGGGECVSVGMDGRVNLVGVGEGGRVEWKRVADSNGLVGYSSVRWGSNVEFATGGLGFGLQWWDQRRPGGAVSQLKGNWSQEEATTQEVKQEDELTILLRLIPLITTGIILSLYLGLQMSTSFLQALVMDLHLTPSLTIPIGSISIFLILSATLSIPLLNYLLYPLHRFLTGQHPTPLARIGFGFLITTLAMVYGALTERKRLHDLQTDAQPMSVLWLVPCFMLVGFGEALHFPGQLAFFYQEFPESFKGSGMAVSALQSGVGSYATSAVIGMIRRFLDGWMADNANESRLDKVYWLMAGVGAVNFGCFVACARLYTRKKGGKS